ncbi:tyrosine protein phosphatase [Pseudolactococcus yaeyamensis]
MIDLHCHILPGIDDGAKNLNDSIKMAKKAVSQGITHILCTPHHNSSYENPKSKVLLQVAELQEELTKRNIPLILYEAQEVRIFEHLMTEINQNEILFADVTDRYLMLEFPMDSIPDYANKLIKQLIARGIIPIIVHPERYKVFQANPSLLEKYLKMGCLAQLTAPSLVGKYGKKIQKLSHYFVKNSMVQMLASDAHDVDNRNFYLAEAYEMIRKKYGEGKIDYYNCVARDIINGDNISLRRYRK